jgi:CMP-N-acetylneuraminic acid synthetase
MLSEGMTMPKWAKALPAITSTQKTANTATFLKPAEPLKTNSIVHSLN